MTRRIPLALWYTFWVALCGSTCLSWARSQRAWDEVSVAVPPSLLLHLGSGGGSLHVQYATGWPGRRGCQWRVMQPRPGGITRNILGERVVHGADPLNWQPPARALSRNAGSMLVERGPASAPATVWMNAHYRRVPHSVVAAGAAVVILTSPGTVALLRKRRRLAERAGR